MATKQSSTTPSFYNFLKEGLLLPTQNRRLFAAVFAVIVVSNSLLFLGNDLAVQPLVDKIQLDTKALNSTDPSSPDYPHLTLETLDDTRVLLLIGAVCLLVSVIIGSVVRIVVLSAAVETYSGKVHTFASLLGKAMERLKGPALTIAFVYVLGIAYLALLTFMAALLFLLLIKNHVALLLVESLVLLVGCVFFVYLSFLWSLSVVVAVAEPGCHGAGAVGRAWRLMKGKFWRVLLFIVVNGLLTAAIWPLQSLVNKRARSDMASGLLLRFVYTILTATVGLFDTCAMTAFYYECKGSTEAKETKYVMLSAKEQINA